MFNNSNGSLKILDKFMKSSMQKNKSSHQLPIGSSSVAGFGNLTPFTSVPSFSMPNGLVDQVDGKMCQTGNHQETRRPSVNDSNSSISFLKMRLSKSFSRSSDDNDQSLENINSTNRKSTKKSNKFSKLTKDITAKARKYSHNSSMDFSSQNILTPDTTFQSVDDSQVQENSYINNVLLELINTEKSYVRDLKDIEQGYRIPMSNNNLFSKEDIKFVFGNIRSIHRFNRKLLKRLLEHQDDVVEICRVFIDNRDGFNIYTNYCTNYLRSIGTLEQYKEVAEIDLFIQDLQKLMKHPLPLHTYLFKPVQRILKYHLLLKNIVDHYDVRSVDFKVVCEAHTCMTDVAGEINDRKKKQEEQIKLNQLLNSIQGLAGINANSLGGLVIEGKLFTVGPREEMMVLLLERGLLITRKRKDGTLVFKMFIVSSRLTLVEIIPREPMAFQVMSYDSPKNLCTLQARSVEEKMVWCREIKTVILDSIKADVPEKVRLLLMRPGLCRDDECEIKHKVSRKMSADLEYLPNSGRSPKTSTPLTPFLRSKLRKSALGKFALDKKNKAKSKAGKRRSRSLENLTKVSNAFSNNSCDNAAQPNAVEVPFVDTLTSGSIFRDKPVKCSPSDGNGSTSNDIDPAYSPSKKSLNRASSFKEALNDDNVYKPRITYSRSFSVAYSPSSDEGDDDDDDDEEMEYSPSESPLVIFIPPCHDSSIDESIADCSISLERDDSTVTLSSGRSFNEINSLESPEFVVDMLSFDGSSRAEYFVNENEIKTLHNCSDVEIVQKFSFDEQSESSDENEASYTLEVPQIFHENDSEFDVPESYDQTEDVDDVDKSIIDDFDVSKLLRNKNTQATNQFVREHKGRRVSLLKRKSAFCREMKKFIPRRSMHYISELEEHNRKSSLPSVFLSESSEEFEICPESKLCLSEDSLPISAPIDDDEMIDIIVTAAEGSSVTKTVTKESNDTDVPTPEGVQADEDKNTGVVALLELIASCQDLSTEVNDSFDKIKLKDDCQPITDQNRPVDDDVSNHNSENGNQLPILKDSAYGSHLLRNKNHNYVFRLARAYSNRFKKFSGTNQDQVKENAETKASSNDSHLKSNNFLNPDIQTAGKGGIVKQRIQQFQDKIS